MKKNNEKAIRDRKIIKAIDKNKEKAIQFIDDDEKVEETLQDFEKRLKLIPKIGGRASDVAVMLSMVRAYVKKQYRQVPKTSILLAIATGIYVVNPFDVMPDVLPFVGYVDDAAAIGMLLQSIHMDLGKYKEWQKENGKC